MQVGKQVFHSFMEDWLLFSSLYQFSAHVEGRKVSEVVKDSFTTKIDLRNKKVLVTDIEPYPQSFYDN